MKISWNNSTVVANRWRCSVIFFAALCIVWVAFISSSAQLKAQKQITSVEMVQGAEGARVTVNSDSPLNDYEAFRRGDRFYVKIPLAEFSFSQPRFQGSGFDDVQVQKVGDSVVVSFKLQLGASARVEQRANRLEVIFTSPNRGHQDRQRDAAGPVPSDQPPVSRQRYAIAPGLEVNVAQRQPPRSARAENNQSGTKPVNNASVASSAPRSVTSPTPVTNYPAASSYTPASTPVPSSKPAIVSTNSPNSKLREWFSANQKAALLAALILAGLLASAAALFYRGRRTETKETNVKPPLAQPKYDSRVELDEMTEYPGERGPVVAPITQEATKFEWIRAASKPAFAPAAEVAASHAAAFLKPSNSSVAVADSKSGNEEREVFEL